jgi:hypothetical protein
VPAWLLWDAALRGRPATRILQLAHPPILCGRHTLQLKSETHVTLWHSADLVLGADARLKEGLMAAVGSEAVVEVAALDYEPGGNVAAVVPVPGAGPGSCQLCMLG